MEKFPHLHFLQKVVGKPRLNGGGGTNPLSAQNKENKLGHFGYLSGRTSQLKSDWDSEISKKEIALLLNLIESMINTSPNHNFILFYVFN